jgi:hypothetical protein
MFMIHIPSYNYKKLLTISLVCLMVFSADIQAQQKMSLPEYIDTYKGIAMKEMRQHGIPASIKLAQAIVESGFGNSELALNANNHFGIKCHGWDGPGYLYDDDEKGECFRVYNHPLESFLDHSRFLLTRQHYAMLFDLDKMDYTAWAYGLRMAGYATNPNYPQMLIRIIEEHGLMHYDKWAMDLTAELPNNFSILQGETMETRRQRAVEDFAPVSLGPRQERQNNRIRYVVARPGDTPESLAKELGMWAWQISRYNELDGQRQITPGQYIYLQPKRRRGEVSQHVVKAGESMYDISQRYGIRLKNLYRRNNMEEGVRLQPGQQLKLR